MDQAALAHQGFLWNFSQCSVPANLDCNFSLCPGCHRQKVIETGSELVRILQIFSLSLFEKPLLNQGFFKSNDTVLEDQIGKPLSLFDS